MEGFQVVAFRLGEEEYAVDINFIKEIIRPTKMTRVPKTEDYIKGVINLRGVVVPIISDMIN
ncbi:CheW-like domain-containing protein [Desulfonispora thiosulfatigenes DSM 11270]|uniref:CheW-like domain-containing protein n=1 Tax=Desulfonispora thiosulfatigenes DSM 11270 TaxID=656914 RepID=A0A1W1VU42_DESTI|nr:chemotaxis protein CheW [Desulfonispora thiosulfatigenes]SMB96631.1 CheW-like domain-containing protein [Desulfonispora thiosulfatigenes DSM 11270]